MANKISAVLGSCAAFIQRAEVIQLAVLAHMRFVSLRFPINYYLERLYGPGQYSENVNQGSFKRGFEENLALQRQDLTESNGRKEDLRSTRLCEPPHRSSRGFDSKVRRRIWKCFKVFDTYRIISTFWLVYVLIKFSLDDQLLENLPIWFGLPPHCYLGGRFIFVEGLSDIIACQFAVLHLAWRLSQSDSRPFYRLGVLDFLVLDQDQLERVYAISDKSECSRDISLSAHEFGQLDGSAILVLDTMCFPIWHGNKVIYRLRSTRTRKSLKTLRKLVAVLTSSAVILRLLAEAVIHVLIYRHVSTDETYVKLYPNCGHPRGWHRYYALSMDIMENAILYFEGGIVWSAAGAMIVLNLDLITLWLDIKRRIGNLLELDSERPGEFRLMTMCAIAKRNQRLQQEARDLIARMSDFFEQVARVDEVISTFLVGLLGASLLICSMFTYYTRVQAIRRVPFQLGLMAAFVLVWILTAAYGFLLLRSFCEGSYVRLCSVIARDPGKHQRKYQNVLDYFNNQRSCFTLMNGVPFRPTTFLTMIGWLFSCFCIITSALRDNYNHEQIATGDHRGASDGFNLHPNK